MSNMGDARFLLRACMRPLCNRRYLLGLCAAILLTLAALSTDPEATGSGLGPCNLGNVGQVEDGARPIRVVVMGNLARHKSRELSLLQEDAALMWAAVSRRHREKPYDLALTVGDNFLPRGVRGMEELRRRWRPYDRLGVRVFGTLGDRDYEGHVQPQLDYTYSTGNVLGRAKTYGTWNLPCSYYTFVLGPLEFVAIDTDEGRLRTSRRVGRRRRARLPPEWPPEARWSTMQERWAVEQLKSRGKAPWRILYGHHDVRGDRQGTWASGLRRGVPGLVDAIAKYGVTAVLSGHDEGMWHEHGDGADYFVAGGGGGRRRKFARCDRVRGCRFATARHGYLEIEASAQHIRFSFLDVYGTQVYGCEKAVGVEECRPWGGGRGK